MTNRAHRHPLAPKIPDSIKQAAYDIISDDPDALNQLVDLAYEAGFGKHARRPPYRDPVVTNMDRVGKAFNDQAVLRAFAMVQNASTVGDHHWQVLAFALRRAGFGWFGEEVAADKALRAAEEAEDKADIEADKAASAAEEAGDADGC